MWAVGFTHVIPVACEALLLMGSLEGDADVSVS